MMLSLSVLLLLPVTISSTIPSTSIVDMIYNFTCFQDFNKEESWLRLEKGGTTTNEENKVGIQARPLLGDELPLSTIALQNFFDMTYFSFEKTRFI